MSTPQEQDDHLPNRNEAAETPNKQIEESPEKDGDKLHNLNISQITASSPLRKCAREVARFLAR